LSEHDDRALCHRSRFIHRAPVELPGLTERCCVSLGFRLTGRGATGRNDTTCVAQAPKVAVSRAIVNKGPIPNETRQLTGWLS
jgi:hypothetical protein